MFPIETCPLPDGALLGRYAPPRAFADCYVTEVGLPVTIARFVAAFYTTPVFRLERLILALVLSRPSTDTEAVQLANGRMDTFSAWRVEDRRDDQLLVADMKGRTRSWFMVSPDPAGPAPRTRLYFGSAVLPVVNPETGAAGMSAGFRALRGFHHYYSEVLLYSARSRLEAAAR
ncbi:MAG: hypothetical protein JNK40_05120 [Chromatiales bacterium]|nr:hypothetical protein [Chromatiales bacterium]